MSHQSRYALGWPTRLTLATAIGGLAVAGALGAWHATQPDRASAGTATVGYGWPIKPFDRPHPVRATFGDPRTIFQGTPSEATLYQGSGSFNFHRGADIYGPSGTKLYPVRDGTVVFLARSASRSTTLPEHQPRCRTQ